MIHRFYIVLLLICVPVLESCAKPFAYGEYIVLERKKVGGTMTPVGDVNKYISVIVEEKLYIPNNENTFGVKCNNPIYKFGQPLRDKGSALYYGLAGIGYLSVNCDTDGAYEVVFDIINGNKLGYYFDGYYIILELNMKQ